MYQEIFDWVLEQKPKDLDLQDFPEEWDILVTRDNKLLFISPERDISYIQATCAEAKVLSKHGIGFEELNDRQLNIIQIVETAMLGGKMTWANYGDQWRVLLDVATGKIDTQLLNVQPGQLMITDEMIDASEHPVKKESLSEESQQRIADNKAGISHNQTVDLTGGAGWQQMSPEEIEALQVAIQKKSEE
jgi:hypothetical protein